MNNKRMQRKMFIERLIRKLSNMDGPGRAGLVRLKDEASLDRGVTYQRDDEPPKPIEVLLVPMAMYEAERRGILAACRLLNSVFLRVPLWRAESGEMRRLLSLLPEEEEWLSACGFPGKCGSAPAIARWDADVDFSGRGVRGMRFYETNGVAVGGLNYIPATEAVTLKILGKTWKGGFGSKLPAGAAACGLHAMLLRLLSSVAKRSGHAGVSIGVLEDETWTSGITEMPYVLEHFKRRGVKAVMADPRKLCVRGERIFLGDLEITVLYRNMELRDLTELEKTHGRLDAVRLAFSRGMVVSSFCGDFDHKSLFEVFTLPSVQERLSRAEKAAVRRHIPWTRLLFDRRTSGPDGKAVDLPAFAARNRRRLVIKPNRSCGGEGVLLGPFAFREQWEAALAAALSDAREWVVQEFIDAARVPHVSVAESGVSRGEYYANCGMVLFPAGMGILGRACGRPVVNVAQGGGLVAVLKLKSP